MALKVLDADGDQKTLKTTTDGSDLVPHHVVASSALPTGAATSAKQDEIVAAIEAIPGGGDATAANQATGNGTLADILAKLSADPATQTTLAAILAKIIAAPSTEAKQDSIITLLTAIAGYVDGLEGKDYATQTTLAALLAKVIAAPATEAKQDTGNTSLATLVTQTDGIEGSLTSILAKIIAAPATEAKQDTQITALGTLATQTTAAAILAKIIAAPATEAKQDTTITSLQLIDDVVLVEDAAHASGDKGVMALAVRTDTRAALAGTTGDYIPITTDALGGVWVAGTQIEDAASADGDRGFGMLSVRQDTLSALVGTDGDYAFVKTDSLGRVWIAGVYLEDAAHSTGHSGMQMLTVRSDVAAATSGTDGDYQPPITDARGRMHVRESLDEYETVAASQTDQIMGATGAQFDLIAGVLIIPASTSPGAVSIKDGNGSAITIFAGGASSVSNLVPFFVPLGLRALAGTTPGWKITTGANVSAIGIGDFT